MLIRALHYATAERIDLRHEDGRVVAIAPASSAPVDREAGWVHDSGDRAEHHELGGLAAGGEVAQVLAKRRAQLRVVQPPPILAEALHDAGRFRHVVAVTQGKVEVGAPDSVHQQCDTEAGSRYACDPRGLKVNAIALL